MNLVILHSYILTISPIIFNNTVISDSQFISDTLANGVEDRFNKSNMAFTPSSLRAQSFSTISSTPHDVKFMNALFTLNKLKFTLFSCTKSADDPDDIPYIFLKNLSNTSLSKLLEIYNLI
jgi:hypothetical protein